MSRIISKTSALRALVQCACALQRARGPEPAYAYAYGAHARSGRALPGHMLIMETFDDGHRQVSTDSIWTITAG